MNTMIYFLCPNNRNHINRAPGTPSNDWICGWCGTRLKYSPIYMFVYPKAEMKDAIYAPDGEPVSQFHLQLYDEKFAAKFADPVKPQVVQPMVQHVSQTTVSSGMESGMESVISTSNVNTYTPPDFVEMTYAQPLITESQSQELLYPVLEQHGYLFLCRDGQFRKYKPGNQIYDHEETVPEPGVVLKGYKGYCTHLHYSTLIMGRNETPKTYYGQGQISYPDYVAFKSNVTYSIELKTPRGRSFKVYLSEHFYDEKVFSSGRSIVQELEVRRGLTPTSVEICLLFDIRNIDNDNQVMTDLKNNIASRTDRKNWWTQNVNCVIFYRSSGLSKAFSIHEILGGQSINNTSQQTNLKSFFTTK